MKIRENSYKKQLWFTLLLIFLVLPGFSQNTSRIQKQFEKARKFYLANQPNEAANEANKILEKNAQYVDALLLLADINGDKDSTKNELQFLEMASKYSSDIRIILRLAKTNYLAGNYFQAKEYYQKYLDKAKITEIRKSEIRYKIESCVFADYAKKHPIQFNPERLSNSINSENDEYWPSLSINQKELVFTRLVKEPGQMPQEDFYISEFENEKWSLAQPIVEINTPYNEGAQSLSANGKYLFFTACNRPGGYGSCDIYYSQRVGGRWTTPRNAGSPLNSAAWETQPSFSSDNKYLYFSSNRKGGKGKKDIWRAAFLGSTSNGQLKWGAPENLGDSINTQGNEISPFIHANNKAFYFASDYRHGMGGFDLFRSEQNTDGTFAEAKNLGYPVNTLEDEQGLNISADGTTAFFSSAREKGSGLDIYTFELEEKMRPEPVTYVQAIISDAKTGKPVHANIQLVNLNASLGNRYEHANTNGEALICFPLGANYAFNVSEDGYLFYSEAFELTETKTVGNPYNIDIKLEPIKMGAEMNFYNIYFETDSFRILPQSIPELQNLVMFLKNNPTLKVEIQGHTDNTGSEQKNQKLSELRAKSVLEFLVKNHIDKSRLNAKGYGMSYPVASNNTPEGKRKNRRTTIKIISK